ncbi:MAG: TetR/AcrR family transcriptional regulator [Solirubrobacteraceae bacterium]
MGDPAYTRLRVDVRRRELIEAAGALFAEHPFEEISMRQIARAAGISKPLVYHYFASKTELFKAAVETRAQELAAVIEPRGTGSGDGDGDVVEELAAGLDAYLAWIEANGRAWSMLMRTATTLPAAREVAEDFRARTLRRILGRLGDADAPRPALRIALKGWLGFVDAAILDWIEHPGLGRRQLRELLLAAFEGALLAAGRADGETVSPDH